MKVNRLAIEALVVGALLLATVMRAVADAPPLAGGSAPDSTTVDRWSRAPLTAPPAEIQATTVETGTLAATLAAELLLGPIDFTISLPIVTKSSP
jgi:hypothetical protein